jgi:hypothetical protein
MQKNLNAQSGIFSKQFPENQLNYCKNGVNCSYKPLANSVAQRLFALLGIFFLSAIFFSFAGCGWYKTKEDLDKVNERLKQLENKTDQLEAQFTETNESITTLGSYVISLKKEWNI